MKSKKIRMMMFAVVLSFLIAAVVEFGIMNVNSFTKQNYSQSVQPVILSGAKKDGKQYYATDDVVQIQYNFSTRYVDKLSFALKNIDNINDASYSVNVNGQEKLMANTMVNGVPNRLFGLSKKTVPIGETTASIQLTIFNLKDSHFQLSKSKISNRFVFNYVRFAIVVVFVFLVSLMFLVVKEYVSFKKWTLITVFTLGTLFAFITPVHYTWDEFAHFIKSYSVSQGAFFLKENELLNYPKNIDTLNFDSGLEYQSFGDFESALAVYETISSNQTEEVNKPTTALLNTFVPYVFSGIGMKVAELFHLPTIFLIWFGRWFNVIAYTLAIWLFLRLAKIGVSSFSYFLLLPVNVFIAASLSTDLFATIGITIGTVLLLNQKNESASNQQWRVVATIFYALAVLIKVTYAPIFLLFFLTVPYERKFYKTRQWRYAICSFITGVITSIISFIYSQSFGGVAQWQIEGIEPVDQVKWMVYHPITFVRLLIDFFKDSLINLIKNMFSALGFVGPEALSQFMTVILIAVLIWILLVDFNQESRQEKLQIHNWEKGLITLQFFASLVLSVVALYITFTPVANQTINGFQGRYILPILPTIFVLMKSSIIRVQTSLLLRQRVVMITILLTNFSVFVEILTQYYGS